MTDKIVNLVGASGSGKTTLAKELEKKGFNVLQSYTTRKPRCKSEWGHTFMEDWFPVYTDSVLTGFESIEGKYIDIDDVVAYFNDYDTSEYYFATKDQYQGKGTSIYIVDPDGAEQVKRNVKDAEVITINLNADEEVRFDRMTMRAFDKNVGEFTADEIMLHAECSEEFEYRIEKDEEIFKVVKCDYTVDANRELEEVLEDVIGIIDND